MDIREIKINMVKLRSLLLEEAIHPDLFLLFGSWAKGTDHKNSDVDIAVVSRDFGKDRFLEGSRLNFQMSKIDARFELVPVSLSEYLDCASISPILHEIRSHGIPLL